MALRERTPALRVAGWPALALRPGRPGAPALILIVGVVLALLAGYGARADTVIDIGSNGDYIYLDGFNAREFSAARPERSFDWPAGADRLAIDGALAAPFQMVTFTLDDFAPSGATPRRLIAVYANEQRLTTLSDRGGQREFRVLLPGSLRRSEGLTLRLEPLADKTLDIPPVQAVRATLSAARTYRWSDGAGVVRLPGYGRGAWRAEIQAVVAHPDGRPVAARLLANGEPIAQLPDYNDSRRISVLLPERVVGGGDLTLTIESQIYSDPRPLGVLIERVSIAPVAGAGGAAIPPLGAGLAALAVALGAYGALRWLGAPPWPTLAAGLALAAVGAWALAAHRAQVGMYLPPLALVVLLSALAAPPLERLAGWAFRKAGLEPAPWLVRALMVIFLAGLWLKAGGMVFPSMRAIDISWHMDRVRWILEGNLAAVYQPGAFSESVMPIDEWGPNRPVIPYSPFFHIFSTAYALIPWWPMELSANLTSALLDTSRVFLIAVLALKSGLSSRAALMAALLYAVTPFTFLLHSWGNVPTTMGMWWTLLATVIIVALYPRLERPAPLALLTAVTLVTLLIYTVMAVFYAVWVIAFLLILRLRPSDVDRRPMRAVLIATGAAIALSLLIYYGQYIPGIIERTIPYMASLATRGPESVGVERAPFSEYLAAYIPHLDYHIWPGDYLYYGVAIPFLFAVPGFLALRRRALVWAALAAWLSVALLFLLAGYRISMVDKQLFYAFPAVCLCWAIYAERYWRRGWAARLMLALVYLFTLVSAVDLWVIRIIRSPVEG